MRFRFLWRTGGSCIVVIGEGRLSLGLALRRPGHGRWSLVIFPWLFGGFVRGHGRDWAYTSKGHWRKTRNTAYLSLVQRGGDDYPAAFLRQNGSLRGVWGLVSASVYICLVRFSGLMGQAEVAKENGSYMYTKSWECFNASYD